MITQIVICSLSHQVPLWPEPSLCACDESSVCHSLSLTFIASLSLSFSLSCFPLSCVSFPLLCLALFCLCFSILWPSLPRCPAVFCVYLLSRTQARQAQASAESCWLFLSPLTRRRSGQRKGSSYRIISSVSVVLKSMLRWCARVGRWNCFNAVWPKWRSS